ncbi:MAG: TAT-variant-translocated molybdopterin oxidoreductase [candidate division Zixibacteria bacterium]|nr:TAT-variant-translocated molybdopterin oxidoreductase [candidate division Zixibacteria bacterium]
MSEMNKKIGKKYWRTIEELGDTPEYRQSVIEEYKRGHEDDENPWSRRSFLTLMGASMALAGLAGCRRPVDKIVPYVDQPEEVVPGVPQYYATTMPQSTGAIGLLVQTREGRPIKIEGNEAHPSSLGSTDALTQASILGLYDPDRSKKTREKGAEKTYDDFVTFWRERAEEFAADKGDGLAVLSEPFSSPTLGRLKQDFLKAYPRATWVAYEPVGDENVGAAIKAVTDDRAAAVYRYERASVILSLDSDFLQSESEAVTAARGFSDGRRMDDLQDEMNRLYVVEPAFTLTGGMADHRLRLPASHVGVFAVALAGELAKRGLSIGTVPSVSSPIPDTGWITALAADLIKAGNNALVVAGRRQPQWVHEIVLLINNALGAVGTTVQYFGHDATDTRVAELANLVDRMNSGAVRTLIMLGGNPVYDAPVDLKFAAALKKIDHTAHLSLYFDETSQAAEWHIPRTHFLEAWGDAVSIDGTKSVIQPMIEPLFGGHADVEMFALLSSGRDQRGHDIVRDTWRSILTTGKFDKAWRRVLHDGLLVGSAAKALPDRRPQPNKTWPKVGATTGSLSATNLEINFYPSHLGDGRYANNPWLQELPDAVSKVAWDNVAVMNPSTAEKLGVRNGDIVRLDVSGNALEIPVWTVPGYADFVLGLPLGYGRRFGGRVADDVGFNTYALRTSSNMYFASGATVTTTGRTYDIANVQDHNRMAGRPIIREASLEEYREEPMFAREMVEHPPLRSIYPDHDYSRGYQWGMTIDLNTCNGCNACVIACQSENNIPVVGKEQVGKGREMAWIRNDRYFAGDADEPQMLHQPVACQQCENAPCEQVCPVAATVHDKEGLNTMNYNRCIGTRYCSNNCPYKVRRFNFFNYVKDMPEVVQMAMNPDVTVRSRGVMEKCTFCIQRINRSKQEAKKEDRTVRDGEFQTACQQACPAKAIQFGNINDPDSRVAKMKEKDRNYALLGELNVRPRSTYLAKLRNPNPEMDG